jgi:conjugal transfer mating pair stabilization protein TraN
MISTIRFGALKCLRSLALVLLVAVAALLGSASLHTASAAPLCIESGAPTCVKTGVTGVCLSYSRNFNCSAKMLPSEIDATKVVLGTASYTVATDLIVKSPECVALLGNASCTMTARVCKGAANETRVVNGVNITKDCWEWDDTYSCVTPVGSDFCAPLVTQGCTKIVGPTCIQNSLTGQCLQETNQYVCAGAPMNPPPTSVTLLTSTYATISDTTVPSQQCQDMAANPLCQKNGQTCTQGPETRIINGLPVFKACWAFEDNYTCATPAAADYCAPLVASGCSKVSGPTCILPGPNGTCAQENYDYTCAGSNPLNPAPANVTYVTQTLVIGAETITTTCDPLRTDPNCTKVSGPTCVDGPGSKVINGVTIFRDCWKYEEKYSCANPGNVVSDCGPLASNPKCTLKATSCILTLAGGQCGEVEKTFSCETQPAQNVTSEVCENMTCDANGVCISAVDQPDPDFGRTAASMELARQMGTYMDPNNLTVFGGEDSRCSKGKLGVSSCCSPKGGGQSNAGLASSMFPAVLTTGKEVLDVGSMYLYDSLMSNDTMQQGVGAMISQVNNWMGGSEGAEFFNGSFDPSFSYMGFGVGIGSAGANTIASMSLGGVDIFISFNPYALLATLVLDWLLTCQQSDHMTGLRKGQNLCHHVGTYCSSKFLGACVEKKETHCCYNSRLARIVQEQGRPQIGKSWGTPEAPVCGGFTQTEIEGLDFSKMDLSEFIQEIQAKAVNTIPGSTRAGATVTNRVTNYFSNPTTSQGGLYLPGNASGNTHKSQTGNAQTQQGTVVP